MHCDVDMVSHLLASGANADGRLCRQRCAAIVMASVCKTPNAVELVVLLHQGGASLEHKDFAGYTAFLRAAEWGNIETADYLLVEGADTTATVNVEGQELNAIDLAEKSEHFKLAHMLQRELEGPPAKN
mmetsp:Transcript_1382/g.4036  ORF Transcript_1382/g.4036 Transcript_1382/m.4036 type:complete len:129 (+) Transcript_1382:883-1269(+)